MRLHWGYTLVALALLVGAIPASAGNTTDETLVGFDIAQITKELRERYKIETST